MMMFRALPPELVEIIYYHFVSSCESVDEQIRALNGQLLVSKEWSECVVGLNLWRELYNVNFPGFSYIAREFCQKERLKKLNPTLVDYIRGLSERDYTAQFYLSSTVIARIVEAIFGLSFVRFFRQEEFGHITFHLFCCSECEHSLSVKPSHEFVLQSRENLLRPLAAIPISCADCAGGALQHLCRIQLHRSRSLTSTASFQYRFAIANLPYFTIGIHILGYSLTQLDKLVLTASTLSRKHPLLVGVFLNEKGILPDDYDQTILSYCAQKEQVEVVPFSHSANTDYLLKTIIRKVVLQKRRSHYEALESRKKGLIMWIAKSFDVNRPGSDVDDLKGGTITCFILQGEVRHGVDLDLRPGIINKDTITPLRARVLSIMLEEDEELGERTVADSRSGLVTITTTLDPVLAKTDRLVGQVAGHISALPAVQDRRTQTFQLRMLSQDNNAKILIKDMLLIKYNWGGIVGGRVLQWNPETCELKVVLTKPICLFPTTFITVSKRKPRMWALIAVGYWRESCAVARQRSKNNRLFV
eukprot:TRINITY_DN22084_c0_g1_i1.p1 TRINITY_DN22084_c0_g1~~TRINITY_DN22084_c0_g1_i1.p1  ORF type:complete len:530 (-),score=33.91 TRINITY_DN22084_c0_g1_i1:255-1844(-)